MKSLFKIIVLLALIAGGYLAATPYLIKNDIELAIEQRDTQRLNELVDFPVLRENMRGQFKEYLMSRTKREMSDNPLGILAMGFVTTMIDGIVDSFVTPSGLADLIKGNAASLVEGGDQGQQADKQRKIFKDAKCKYDSIDKFSIWVPNVNGELTRVVLTRRGIEWRLDNIVLPGFE